MAVKFYSDITKKFYDDEQTAKEEENKLKKIHDDKLAKKKAMAQEVDQKRQAFTKARDEYNDALNEFCKQYGAYHYTIGADDVAKEMNKTLFNLFSW